MADTLFDRFASTPEGKKLLNRGRLSLKVTEAICRCMKEKGITRKELADMLGKTKGRVSQMLDGERNLTLHTVADIFTVLDTAVEIGCVRETHLMQHGTAGVYRWVTAAPARELPWQFEDGTSTVESLDVAS